MPISIPASSWSWSSHEIRVGGVGRLADRLFGEPPTPVHPVAWFGRVMRKLEEITYEDSRMAGVVLAGAGVSLVLIAGVIANCVLGRSVATATAVNVCAAGRMP